MADEQKLSFKSRVRNVAIQCAADYYSQYVCYDYLLISDAFVDRPFYVISAEKDNYLHLTGVSTPLSAREFFDKCHDATLTEADFEISAHGQDEKASKGTIRRKINALPFIFSLLNTRCMVEENFRKNTILCSFASSDGTCTLGFVSVPSARPKTLLIGNELNQSRSSSVKVVLRKLRSEQLFDTVFSGDVNDLMPHYSHVQELLSDNLKNSINELLQKSKDATTVESQHNTDTDSPSAE